MKSGIVSAHRTTVSAALGIAGVLGIGGWIFGWYSQFPWYDELTHAISAFAVTFAAGLLLYGRVLTGANESRAVFILALTLVGLGIGGAWEFLEFAYDRLSGPSNVIQGKFDTMIDLCWDTAGALAAAMYVAGIARDRT